MDLTFTRSKAARKDDRLVIFNFADGRPGSVQFLRTAFPEQVPETITMSGDFAEKTERVAKAKETPEERKARLANLPKLTLAEKVAKAEERAAKLRAKLAKTVDAGAQASM
jgi:rRNA maturation protein Rpf1